MVLVVDGVELPLVSSPGGPELDLSDPWLENMQWVVNLAVRGDEPGLVDALRAGRRVTGQELFVEPEVSDTAAAASDPHWRRLTGHALPRDEPLIELRMGFLPASTVVPLRWLVRVVDELEARRRETAVEPPWLFRTPAAAVHPHPEGDRHALGALERTVATIDEQTAAIDPSAREPADLIEWRWQVMQELEQYGLLDEEHADHKQHWLSAWGFAHLASWYGAVLEAIAYLASDERRRYNPDAHAVAVLGAPVAIDLFRSGLDPPVGVSRGEWAAWGEYILRTTDCDGLQGEIFYHDQDGFVTVMWRCDAPGVPAVLAVSLSAA